MYFKEDWEAAMDSEIFREYVKGELQKEAVEAANKVVNEADQLEKTLDEDLSAYAKLEQFQKQINSSPKLREYFLKCKAALEKNPELRNKIDPKFLAGLELLDLSGE